MVFISMMNKRHKMNLKTTETNKSKKTIIGMIYFMEKNMILKNIQKKKKIKSNINFAKGYLIQLERLSSQVKAKEKSKKKETRKQKKKKKCTEK